MNVSIKVDRTHKNTEKVVMKWFAQASSKNQDQNSNPSLMDCSLLTLLTSSLISPVYDIQTLRGRAT